jgi:hypothetical protein
MVREVEMEMELERGIGGWGISLLFIQELYRGSAPGSLSFFKRVHHGRTLWTLMIGLGSIPPFY